MAMVLKMTIGLKISCLVGINIYIISQIDYVLSEQKNVKSVIPLFQNDHDFAISLKRIKQTLTFYGIESNLL